MKTTLDIDEDVLVAAKELGRSRNLTAGQAVSRLLRKVLTGQAGRTTALVEQTSGSPAIAGFRPFSAGQCQDSQLRPGTVDPGLLRIHPHRLHTLIRQCRDKPVPC